MIIYEISCVAVDMVNCEDCTKPCIEVLCEHKSSIKTIIHSDAIMQEDEIKKLLEGGRDFKYFSFCVGN